MCECERGFVHNNETNACERICEEVCTNGECITNGIDTITAKPPLYPGLRTIPNTESKYYVGANGQVVENASVLTNIKWFSPENETV